MVDGKKISVRYDHDSDEYIVHEPHARRKIIRASAMVGKHGMTLEQQTMMDNLNKPKPARSKKGTDFSGTAIVSSVWEID